MKRTEDIFSSFSMSDSLPDDELLLSLSSPEIKWSQIKINGCGDGFNDESNLIANIYT